MKNYEFIEKMQKENYDNGFTMDLDVFKGDKLVHVAYDTSNIDVSKRMLVFIDNLDIDTYVDTINTINVNYFDENDLILPIRTWLRKECKQSDIENKFDYDDLVDTGIVEIYNYDGDSEIWNYELRINH